MTKHVETPESVLIIEDDPNFSNLLKRWLETAGYRTEIFADGKNCLANLAGLLPVCVCLDLNLPDENGLQILEKLKLLNKNLPVIMLTADVATENAVRAIQLGAYDYLVKPTDRAKFLTTVKNAVERFQMALRLAHLERETSGKNFHGLIGNSPKMRSLYLEIEKVAACDITVLIEGESGTGKELVARAIHQNSGRAKFPFVALNCAAIPETLQESELFGHEKGAFTGAFSRRHGKFEAAHGGTLFLDEVAELSLSLQAKLLRVLQERTFSRLGSSDEISSDFRLLAASHKNLYEEVEKGNFREDLFFRLAVYELEVAPLRERREDIALLINFLLKEAGKIHKKDYKISPEALEILENHNFNGNVRELQNYIQRALVTANENTIRVEDLPKRVFKQSAPHIAAEKSFNEVQKIAAEPEKIEKVINFSNGNLPVMSLENLEKLAIQSALDRNQGNLTNVAGELGIGRTTLYRKIKQFGLE